MNTSKSYYSIENRSEAEADILIYGEIGDSWFDESVTARQFSADFKDLEKTAKRINVRINSPGGSVFDGLAIFNTIRNSEAETHTYNDGIAASMAALVLMAGKNVHAASNSLTMIHPPMAMAYGNAKEFEKTIDVLNKVEGSLIDCISSKCGKTAQEVKAAWFDGADHWFSAAEAQTEGFVDDLTTADNKVNQKVKNLRHEEIMARFDEFAPQAVKEQKKVANWFMNLFTHPEPAATAPENEISDNDMDIQILRDAFGMNDSATETEIVSLATGLMTDLAARGQQIAQNETDMAALQAQLAQVQADFEAFKTQAGASSAAAVVDTDALDTTGKGADNFFEAFAACKEALGK